MCGIAGFIGEGDREQLKRMTDVIRHRGPDDGGFFIHTPLTSPLERGLSGVPSMRGVPEGRGAYLGMRRLSIIDVAGGKQPIFNEDGTVVVVYNGEIYNYQELRSDLGKKGHRLKTNSDTEVIVHLYEEHGNGLFEKLNGMFAIALWDSRNKKLLLGRDRMGEKPLYYAHVNSSFYFASELKVFSKISGFLKELNRETFVRFIDQGYCVGNETIWKGVNKLGAGEWLVFEGGKIKIGKYWELPFLSSRAEASGVEGSHHVDFSGEISPRGFRLGRDDDKEFEETVNQLDRLLSDAVKIRLMSEVPLGVFLSGGLDSSIITYYAQKNSQLPIRTFTVKFEEESFDESRYARTISQFLGTDHTEEVVSERELISIIDDLPSIMDEPLADSSLIPTYWLSRVTRKHVTVALGGDGGDELFFGYQTFLAWKYWNLVRKQPKFLRDIESFLVEILPSGSDYFSLDFKLKRGLLNFDPNPYNQHFRWFSPFTNEEFEQLFSSEVSAYFFCYSNKSKHSYFDYRELQQVTSDREKISDFSTQSAYLYQKYYLPDDIFTKVDRAAMANSLETRAPFVDPRLIEFANSLPADYKLHNGETKYILKKLAERILPKKIAKREKHGFPSPIDRWMRGPLKERVSEALRHEGIKEQGQLNADYVQFLWQDFLNGNHYRARQIWSLFVWQLWSEKYVL